MILESRIAKEPSGLDTRSARSLEALSVASARWSMRALSTVRREGGEGW